MINNEFKKIITFSIKWSFFWLSIFGLQYVFLHSDDLKDYYFYPSLSVIYFLGITIITGYSYGLHSDKSFQQQYNNAYYVLPIVFLGFLLISPILNYSIPLSRELKEYLIANNFHYPLFFNTTTSIKVADITFQQILIFIFFKQMRGITKNKKRTVFVFTTVFAAIHAPLLLSFDWWMSALFLGASAGAGLIFSYFHLYSRYGLIFSLMIHQAFYVSVGFALRYVYWV